MRLREFIATASGLLDFLPLLRKATKQMESSTLDHETARRVVSNVLGKLDALAHKFDENAARSKAWRQFVQDVRKAGVKVKATGGRSEEWIDNMLRTFAKALYASHEEILQDLEILAALQHLFDVNAEGFPDPHTLPTSDDLNDYYRALSPSSTATPTAKPMRAGNQTSPAVTLHENGTIFEFPTPSLHLVINRRSFPMSIVKRSDVLLKKIQTSRNATSKRLDVVTRANKSPCLST
eukprot:m.317709 g.317709  ORF g.317709 m.317709 type:complete len:237 (+) comp16438_c1_seq1:1660-2370(+)